MLITDDVQTGLHGDLIHDCGRFIAIAEVFDALTSERVYQPAVRTYPALKSTYQSVGNFDGRLLHQKITPEKLLEMICIKTYIW